MDTTELPAITHVWSQFGHTFLSCGDGEDEWGQECHSCLTCGAHFSLKRRDDDPSGGDYIAANGDDPIQCTGRTDLTHGEAPCNADNGRGCEASQDGPCEHEAHTHGCNCLLCTG